MAERTIPPKPTALDDEFDRLTVDTNTLVANLSGYADRVGIGTATPSNDLHISGDDTRVLIESTAANNNAQITLQTTAQQTHIGANIKENGSAWEVVDATAGNLTRLHLDASGNLGIGVSDPDHTLELAGVLHVSDEVAAPSAPSSGDGGCIYVKSDGKLYYISDTVAETDVASGGTGTVTSVTAAADSGSGTAITSSGTFTYTGGTGVTTSVSGTTVTVAADNNGTVTSVTPAADSGSGTAITASGTLTYTGGTGVTTSVSGTTVTVDADNNGTVTSITPGGDSGSGTAITGSGTITVAGTSNEIETAVSGTTVTVGLPDDVTVGNTLTVDTDVASTTSHTTASSHIDVDVTGIIATGQTGNNIGLNLDLNSNSPTMVGAVNNTGIDVDLVGGTSGAQTNVGLDVNVSGADTNYAALFNGGNVGIGTSAPSAPLHVKGANPTVYFEDTDTNYTLNFRNGLVMGWGSVADPDSFMELGPNAGSGDNHLDTADRDFHLFGTTTTVGFFFDESDCLFGFGEDSPRTLIHGKGAEAYLTLQNSTDEHGAGEAETRINFEDHANETLAQLQGSHSGSSDDTKGQFSILTNNGTSLTSALTIDDTQRATFAGDVAVGGNDILDNGGENIIGSDGSGNVDVAAAGKSTTISGPVVLGQGKREAFSSIAAAGPTVIDATYTWVNTDASSNQVDLTLPSAATVGPGFLLYFNDFSGTGGTNDIVITRDGTDTIGGATSKTISMPNGYLWLISNGTNGWGVISELLS